ncbi:MAG TPA: serine/threonine-protein kinase, partial [Pirellulales bacterium]
MTGSEGSKIGRFEIIEELGRGAHGIVFLAWDPAARRQVALKTPHPDVLFTPELRARFIREGVAAARLAHTNIISVLEVDQSGPVCYIVSSFCEGKALAAFLMERAESPPLEVAAQWTAELADAVEHAHRHGILHRDLKPANVILEPAPGCLAHDEDPSGTPRKNNDQALVPKLTDFGLAKLIDSQDMRSRTGVLLGTPAYMAPEQVDSRLGAIGPPTDVYGLGAILYELLTLKRPFMADSQADLLRQIACGDPPAPSLLRNDLPRDLEAICLRCLQRTPRDRYPSAAALAADLRRFQAGEVTLARPLGIAGRLGKWARRRPASATALAVGVLAALLLAVGASWHFVEMGHALGVAEEARAHAVQRGEELQHMIYARDLQGTHQALAQQNVRNAKYLLDRNQPV